MIQIKGIDKNFNLDLLIALGGGGGGLDMWCYGEVPLFWVLFGGALGFLVSLWIVPGFLVYLDSVDL